MLSIFLVMVLYVALSVVFFGGWALSFPYLRDFPLRTVSISLFLNFLFNAVLSSWFLFFSVDFVILYIAHLSLGIGGWAYFTLRRKPTSDRSIDPRQRLSLKFVAVTIALIIGFYAAPKIHDLNDAGITYRFGPDLIGYGIAVGAITDFKNLKEIESNYAELHDPPLTVPARELSIESAQRRSSFQSLVSTGFLLRDYRWTLTIFSEAVQIAGERYLWAIILGVSTISAVLAGLIIQYLVFQKTRNNLRSIGAALMSVVSATVLNGFHEGGIVQALSLPAIALVVFAIFSEEINDQSRKIFAASAIALLLPTYSSPVTTLIPIALMCLAGSIVLRSKEIQRRVVTILVGSTFGAIVVLPHLYRYTKYLPQAIADGSYAGWTLPRWMTPVEMLGFVNSYDQKYTGYVNRSTVLLVFLVIANGSLFFAVGRRVIWKIASLETQVLVSVSLMIFTIYVKTRYIDLGKNYQLFKGVGYLIPFISVSLFCLECPKRLRIASGELNGKKLVIYRDLYALTLTILVVLGSSSYLVRYMQRDEYIPASETSVHSDAKELLNNSNIVAPDDYRTWQLASQLELDLYTRAPFGVVPPIDKRENLPSYLLIRQQNCPEWSCISRTSLSEEMFSSNILPIISVNEDVKAILLESTSKTLGYLIDNNVDPQSWFGTFSEMTKLLYGFDLDNKYIPINTE